MGPKRLRICSVETLGQKLNVRHGCCLSEQIISLKFNHPETFVHPSGRTVCAGKEGSAILMSRNSQRRTVSSLERDLGAGVGALAAALAQLSGFMSARTITAFLADVYATTADYLGKIHIIADEMVCVHFVLQKNNNCRGK
ncbi:hypothetical protein L2E82_45400 [Cichorium intybus]|uniref:Uncharacterized protein n=1 Tax=Cichorium intybus TaxID=13427 RepID=A0ACB8ZRX1_CICIN|nr:hypothetical protein L2E82_45400 [Cichorium intybus]